MHTDKGEVVLSVCIRVHPWLKLILVRKRIPEPDPQIEEVRPSRVILVHGICASYIPDRKHGEIRQPAANPDPRAGLDKIRPVLPLQVQQVDKIIGHPAAAEEWQVRDDDHACEPQDRAARGREPTSRI